MSIDIYTDGSCSQGVGGFGALIFDSDVVTQPNVFYLPYPDRIEIYGGENNTTNNRMELMAAIVALKALNHERSVRIYTDSQYVQKGISTWIMKWRVNGWRTSNGKPVLNKDLWQILEIESAKRVIDWQWVKAHAGNQWNSRADELANWGRCNL